MIMTDATRERGAQGERQDTQQLESRVAEQARELKQVRAKFERYETALRGSNVTIYTQDRELRYTSMSRPMFGYEADAIIGRTDDEILPAESRVQIVALKREVLETGAPKDGEVTIKDATGARSYDLHIEPLRDPDGQITGITCAVVDVTERKEGEAHLRLLMREITHRSKNLLAVIQGMARQTARHAGSIQGFLDQFSARLQALAASHDLLVEESWRGASLYQLVRSQLGHYFDRGGSQVSIDGPPIALKPEAAQNLGLAMHELSANAAKYGALSVPAGRVMISWRRLDLAQGNGLEILWVEEGGPKVRNPRRRGFGSLVIEHNLTRSVNAEVELKFAPEGVRCRIVIPSAQMQSAD